MVKHKHIGIRAIEKEDLPTLHTWRNNDNLRRYFREYREMSMLQKESWYQNMIFDKNFEMFMIVDLENKKSPVGVTGFTYIDWVNRHCDLHFYIGKDEKWIDDKYCPTAMELVLNRGFLFMNMNKIWVEIYEIDSKKLDFFKKFGFSTDACLRQHYYYNGKYYNSYILSMLKDEYEKVFNSRRAS